MIRRRGRNRVPLSAVAVFCIAVLAASSAVVDGNRTARARAEREAAAAAADSVAAVAAAVRATLTAAASPAPAGSQGPNGTAPGRGASAASKILARDSGRPVLADAGAGAVVVALFDTSAEPATVGERRAHVIGYRVVPLQLRSTLTDLKPADGGISVSGPKRQIISLPGRRPSSAPADTATLGPDLPDGWSVTAWTKPASTPGSAWLLALVLLAAGLAASSSLTLRQQAARRSGEELHGLEKTSAALAALATLAQHSLDLGEVLPAVTTELSSALGLRGISVAAPTPTGERPIFLWGAPPDEGEEVHGAEVLRAGQTLVQVLSRGGRVVARLRVTAGRDLDPHEVRILVGAGDILTSALSNADAFSQQVELVRRMRAVDELKTVFLATASHELRTPVATISGYANLLHSSWDQLSPERARDYAERVDSIAQRLNGLVEDMLDFSRLQTANRSGVATEVLDLGATVETVLAEQPDLAPDHRLRCDPVRDLRVSGSRRAVERVLVNLVGNAAKYSDPGSEIRVLVRENEGRAELVVEDDGPGIPAEERARIFSPFYRGHGDEVLRTRGAGLGLAIVAEFAASMDGVASVDQADSGGASFVVSYPVLVRSLDPDAGDAHEQV